MLGLFSTNSNACTISCILILLSAVIVTNALIISPVPLTTPSCPMFVGGSNSTTGPPPPPPPPPQPARAVVPAKNSAVNPLLNIKPSCYIYAVFAFAMETKTWT